MKKLFLLILFVSTFYMDVYTVFAQSDDGISAIMEEHLDFSQINSVIDKSVKKEGIMDTSFSELAYKAVSGTLDLSMSNILDTVGRTFFNELYTNSDLMRNLVILGILCAVIKTLTDAYKDKEVGELGFYAGYMVIVTLLVTSFNVAAGIISSLINTLSQIMEASIPLMMSLLVMSGNVAGAYAINPVMMFVMNLVTVFVKNILMPVIIMCASVQIINYIVERDVLTKFTELIKSAAGWALKGITLLYAAVISLQRISAPIVNNLAAKTGKAAVKAIPVVGGIIDGTLDTVMYWTGAAKSGVLAAVIIIIIAACAVPVIKVLAIIASYKIAAALIQPVSDARVVKCIDSAGSFAAMALQAGVTVIVMFIYSVIILLSF